MFPQADTFLNPHIQSTKVNVVRRLEFGRSLAPATENNWRNLNNDTLVHTSPEIYNSFHNLIRTFVLRWRSLWWLLRGKQILRILPGQLFHLRQSSIKKKQDNWLAWFFCILTQTFSWKWPRNIWSSQSFLNFFNRLLPLNVTQESLTELSLSSSPRLLEKLLNLFTEVELGRVDGLLFFLDAGNVDVDARRSLLADVDAVRDFVVTRARNVDIVVVSLGRRPRRRRGRRPRAGRRSERGWQAVRRLLRCRWGYWQNWPLHFCKFSSN